MHFFKKITAFIFVTVLVGAFSTNPALADRNDQSGHGHADRKKAKNVIILVPDGCSQSIQTLARWYKGERLALDEIQVGVVKHEMANSVITGSAAAATAFSTGYKTTVRFLSVGPREDDVLSTYEWPEHPETFSYKPLATVMEGAKLKGMATGLVSTSRFTHATPAAWACHSADRGNEHTDISEHMVYNEIDLIFGGGERNLIPESEGGKRIDEENLLDVLVDRGYTIARTKDEMAAVAQLPVFGMFAMSHMDAEIDRPIYNPHEPSLADMTAKAIELLSQDPDGFIVMIEGSEVDWAGHANDPIHMVTDFIEFDEAVKVALDFAKKDGNTLVLAYPDHNTGGMDIGNRAYNTAYTGLSVEDLIQPLKGMTVTAESVAMEIGDVEIGDDQSCYQIMAKISELWNIDFTDYSDEEFFGECKEIRDLASGDAGSLYYAIGRVISKNHTAIGWTSHGHNAEDVPLWAYGPGAPRGLVDNTELAETVADALGLNMKKIQKWLFADLDDHYSERWSLDTHDELNPVAKLSGKWFSAELPCSKDLLTVTNKKNGKTKTFNLDGVVVHAENTGRVYVPREAIRLMKAYGIR